jgi:hypothetical protein
MDDQELCRLSFPNGMLLGYVEFLKNGVIIMLN